MVRVWGGGIYEADDFYDICDGAHCPLHCGLDWPLTCITITLRRARYPSMAGLYVWLWTGMSSGLTRAASAYRYDYQYPAYDSFTKSVELEAEQNVKRLRHHPSVVIFGMYSVFPYLSTQCSPEHYTAGNNEGWSHGNCFARGLSPLTPLCLQTISWRSRTSSIWTTVMRSRISATPTSRHDTSTSIFCRRSSSG